jgi:GxxExxY protein
MEHEETKERSFIAEDDYNRLLSISNIIIGAAIEVHKELGPGLLESVYEDCLKVELEERGLQVKTQVDLPLIYKKKDTGKFYRIDMLVEDVFIVELKAVELLKPLHEVQLLTYMKLSGIKMGLLINFNVPKLREGIKRKLNGYLEYNGIKPVRA